MTNAADRRPVILINPVLKTIVQDEKLDYAASFEMCYQFRLLYVQGRQYPITGAERMAYPCRSELFKRVNEPSGKEKFVILSTFSGQPNDDELNDKFEGRTRDQS